LRALRQTWPAAAVDVLTTPAGAAVLDGLDSVDRLWLADKHQLDSPARAPLAGPGFLPLLRRLRAEHYDQLLLFHHLTTAFGAAKYAMLCAAIGARRTVGLDNGRGRFLDVRVPDLGFGRRHEVDYCLDVAVAAGATRPSDPRLEIALTDVDRRRAAELAPAGAIALHPGGGPYSLARRWPAEHFAEVARLLLRVTAVLSDTADRPLRSGANPAFVLVGAQADVEPSDRLEAGLDGQALNLVCKTSLKETAAVLARCKLLISNDSGVVHFATAVGTPVVAVFGPSNDQAWGPYPPKEHRVVRASLPCSPCFYRGKSLGTPQGCSTRECLQLVTPETVVQAAQQLLAKHA
jgi:heptosyltransferase-2